MTSPMITLGDEPDPLDEVQVPGALSEPEVVEFTKDESIVFMNALEIGKTSKTVSVCGRRVRIKTVNTDEELALGLVIKPWIGTDAYNRAYKTTLVAACTMEIDGQPVFTPISDEDVETEVQGRFERVKKYYPFFIDAVYEKIIEMEQELKPVLEKLYTLGKGLS